MFKKIGKFIVKHMDKIKEVVFVIAEKILKKTSTKEGEENNINNNKI